MSFTVTVKPPVKMRCGDCVFFSIRKGGECHHNSPKSQYERTSGGGPRDALVVELKSIWPPVSEDDFCGDFLPIKNDAMER